MTDLEKYDAVNKCETAKELSDVILSFADVRGFIQGREKAFSAAKMADGAILVVENDFISPNILTRAFGIRQQALYLKYYGRN